MNCPDLKITTNPMRGLSRMLLVASLLGFQAAAQANDAWTFNLVNAPVAININSPGHESIRMTGAGTFDPVAGTVQASGAYELFNAFDHPNGPIVRGTWVATGFVSFEDGVLKIEIATQDNTGGGTGTGEMWITTDGIAGPIYAGEPYRIPVGGSGGGAKFHAHGNAG
jgi:hypothetical protein